MLDGGLLQFWRGQNRVKGVSATILWGRNTAQVSSIQTFVRRIKSTLTAAAAMTHHSTPMTVRSSSTRVTPSPPGGAQIGAGKYRHAGVSTNTEMVVQRHGAQSMDMSTNNRHVTTTQLRIIVLTRSTAYATPVCVNPDDHSAMQFLRALTARMDALQRQNLVMILRRWAMLLERSSPVEPRPSPPPPPPPDPSGN